MKSEPRWQDWVNLIFGVWLFISPFTLGYQSVGGVAAWNSYILGVAVAVFAIWALSQPRVWEEWVNLVLGIWLIISPFVLGFTGDSAALWNNIILGILVGGDALWAAMQPPRHSVA